MHLLSSALEGKEEVVVVVEEEEEEEFQLFAVLF